MSRKKPITIREIRYKEKTPEEEEKCRKKLQDLMVTILWEYNNNVYETET